MHPFALLLAATCVHATPIAGTQSDLHAPLEAVVRPHAAPSRQLHGRFLHITDLHPDPFYKIHSSTAEEDACHRGQGASGTYGAETTDCDAPFALINATFKWIEDNLKDNIDFVVWTGDSARHDSDEEIPRTHQEVLNTNRWVAEKFVEVFGKDDDPKNALMIPIISTFGNNDILPHNILLSGPNKWLRVYSDIWSNFIPEEQRHGFERGGWYYVEVIPNKLAVFSLNTLYFFANNAAVDGCALRSEPGYDHMEWLRIQLQFMRERGMKAILTGHVPPARTESKRLWDETCWQKYTLWLKQYRDVVVGGLYGHMNIDHFMLQDTKEIDILAVAGHQSTNHIARVMMDEEFSVESATDYLEELRQDWSDLPNPKARNKEVDKSKKKNAKKGKKEKTSKKIGGPWAERYQVTQVGPSVVPNYFPTLRVIEYNITGLEGATVWADHFAASQSNVRMDWLENDAEIVVGDNAYRDEFVVHENLLGAKNRKEHKKPKTPDFTIPDPPSKNSPPGPAYSPQTLTMLGYTQYFANLTNINNDFLKSQDEGLDANKWHDGKHHGKHPEKDEPKLFQYQAEYDTFSDSIYELKDMTVRSYIKLAHRIGQYKPEMGDQIDEILDIAEDSLDDNDEEEAYVEKGKKHKKKKKKQHNQHERNKVWLQFVKRAFIGTLDDKDLQSLEQDAEINVAGLLVHDEKDNMHDGEL